MTRRRMLARTTAALPVLLCDPAAPLSAEAPVRRRLGICGYSFNLHWKAARDGAPGARFKDPIEFLEYCGRLGAGGVQVGLGSRDAAYNQRLRARAESLGLYLEGELSLPRDESDAARFEAEIRTAKEAGAGVVRTAMLGGRRYETFDSADAFRRFAEHSWQSLALAEPVLKKHRVRLAVENHKDRRVAELTDLLKRIGSEYVGVCLDTGNNIALLEDPMEVVQALAPYAFSTHLKDMALQPYEEGFLLSEVNLGEGCLDLKRMIAVLLKANPKIQFNLEMITRDPLKVPCLTSKYFATMEDARASQLVAALDRVRRDASKNPLPRTSGLDAARQLDLEEKNVLACLAYARDNLGL